MQITSQLSIDLKQQNIREYVDAVQNDSNTRIVKIKILDGGSSWTVPSGTKVALGYRKSDGNRGIYDTLPNGSAACSISGDTVSIILASQVLTTPGIVNAVATMNNADGNQLSTLPFSIRVHADPASGAVKSENYYNYSSWEDLNKAADAWFAEQNQKVAEAVNTANTAASRAENALTVTEDAVKKAAQAVTDAETAVGDAEQAVEDAAATQKRADEVTEQVEKYLEDGEFDRRMGESVAEYLEDNPPVRHSWSGTTLSITSGSGTTSADLQGPRGPQGERGNVYVAEFRVDDGYLLMDYPEGYDGASFNVNESGYLEVSF